jgi:hypothetical protein
MDRWVTQGEWKMNWVMHHHYVVEATPYPFRRAFVVGVGFTDTQSGRAFIPVPVFAFAE